MPKDVHDCVERLKSKKGFYQGKKDRESIAWGICWNIKKRKKKASTESMIRLAQILDDSGEHDAADIVDQSIEPTQKYDLSKLRKALEDLDFKLTGKAKSEFERQKSDADILESLYDGREYYLNDGGYSRVALRPGPPNYDSLTISYTSNSTDRVKSAWENAQPEIQAVLDAANELYSDEAYQALSSML